MKYSDVLIEWIQSSGYTHCYFVAGGNIMHLLNSARQNLICVPVGEVAAVIAAEYHNSIVKAGSSSQATGKAFALVTAGPGLLNTSLLSRAWLESREILCLVGR